MRIRDLLRRVEGATPIRVILSDFIEACAHNNTGSCVLRCDMKVLLCKCQEISSEEKSLIRDVIGDLRQRAEPKSAIADDCADILEAHGGL